MAEAILSGIYKIENLATGQQYIGSALDFGNRWKKHRYQLGKQIHHSTHLQRAWDKHGECAFQFEVIEYVGEKSNLTPREQYWMDALQPDYNIAKIAGSCLGIKRSEETKAKARGRKMSPEAVEASRLARVGRKRSEEVRRKMSIAQTGLIRGPQSEAHRKKISLANTGFKHSEEAKQKMSASSKISESKKAAQAAATLAAVLVHKGKPKSPESIARRTATRAANRLAKATT